MYKQKKIFALIPARAGSKGVPNKNLKTLLGKPLIAWTIEFAKMCKYVDKVIVSTDSKEIAEVSKRFGAEVPFMRPKNLAKDDTPMYKVVLHAIRTLKALGEKFDVIVLLQPTSPLRTHKDIERAIERFLSSSAKSLVSVCERSKYYFWAMEINAYGYLKIKKIPSRRQVLPKVYVPNGAIYISHVNVFLKEKTFFTNRTLPFIMPEERSIDIDTETDFKIAECLMRDVLKLA